MSEASEAIARARDQGLVELSINTDDLSELRAACALTGLKKLRISGATALPPELGQLVNLECLNLENTSITALPPEIGALSKLTDLYAYSTGLTALPDTIGALKGLESLVIWACAITHLPESIGELSALTSLDLHANPIAALPDSIGRLSRLADLDLHRTELTGVPADLSGMAALASLDLGQCALDHFPPGLLTLPALGVLKLKGNRIDALPQDIGRLAGLKHLSLSGYYDKKNRVAALPDSLFTMTRLEALLLRDNLLTQVPVGLARMPSLRRLELDGNPIDGVPPAVLARGMRAVFVHLGYAEARVARTPSPAELAAARPVYADRIAAFRRESRDKSHKQALLPDILEFLEGKRHTVPSLSPEAHYGFSTLPSVLSPVAEWTWVDERVLAMLAGDAWCWQRFNDFNNSYFDQGFHEEFMGWLRGQIPDEGDLDTAGRALAALAALGVDDEDKHLEHLVDALREHLQTPDKRPTSAGRYVLDRMPDRLDVVLAATEGKIMRAPLLDLIVRHKLQALPREHLEALIFPPPDPQAELRHAPYAALSRLTDIDPSGFEPWVLRAMEDTDCMHCRGELAWILVERCGSHREAALEATRAVFTHITERKNTKDGASFYWSGGPSRWSDGTARWVTWSLETFGEAVRDAVFEMISETRRMNLDVIEATWRALGPAAMPAVSEALKMDLGGRNMGDHYRRVYGLLEDTPLPEAVEEKIWSLAVRENKDVRIATAGFLSRRGDAAVSRAIPLLTDKATESREAGARILAMAGGEVARAALAARVDSERNEDVRDLMVGGLYSPDEVIDRAEARRRVAAAAKRGKLKKPVKPWVDGVGALQWTDGEALTVEEQRYLFYRQNRLPLVAIEPEVGGVLGLIDGASSGPWAAELMRRVLKNGHVSAKNRFALSLVGALGDDAVAKPLTEAAIAKRSPHAVAALAMIGTDAAARGLEAIQEAFATRYKNIGEAAVSAFAQVAVARGLSAYQLADRILPDLGFSGGVQPIQVGADTYLLGVSPDLKLTWAGPGGKTTKSPPKAASKAVKDSAKALQKAVRGLGREQVAGLDSYLGSGRRWSPQEWLAYVGGNAVTGALAQAALWGEYGDGGLVRAFLYRAGGCQDRSGASMTPAGAVGLVHPFELDAAARGAWAARLKALKIKAVIPQLERETFAVDPACADDGFDHRFEEVQVAVGAFKSRADRLGWRRGSVIDSGEVSAYRKTFGDREVFVMLNNLPVQSWGDDDSEVTLREVFFVAPGAVKTGSYTYDEPRREGDARLVKLGQVPPLVYSEAVRELSRIAGVI